MKLRNLIIMGILVITASGCGLKKETATESDKINIISETNFHDKVSKNESELFETETNIEKITTNTNQWKISDKNVKGLNDTVRISGYDGVDKSITVRSVNFSKEYTGNKFEDHQKEMLSILNAQYDEKGNLLDNNIYLNLEVQVTNHENYGEWNVGDYSIVLLQDDMTLLNSVDGPILIHCNELVKDYSQKDCLFIPFKPEESQTLHIIYAMKEENKDARWGYFVSLASPWFPDENSYFIEF